MSLLARWSFDSVDGPCSDSSGAGQHLTYVGTTSVTGKLGSGRRLQNPSSTAEYVYGPSNAASRTAALGSWTWTGWVRRNEPDSNFRVGVYVSLGGDANVGDSANNSLLLIDYLPTLGYLVVSWDGISDSIITTNISSDDAWHHVAVVKNTSGTTLKFYVDGALTDTQPYSGEPSGGSSAIWSFGAVLNDGFSGETNASFDDFRFYSTALTTAEVLALYTAGATMGSVSLTTLRARVREAFDMTGSGFVTDAATSLDAFINAALDELYDVILQHFGEDYYVSSSSLTTVAGTSAYSLPNDFYKLLGVDLTWNGDSVSLEPFNFAERNAFKASINLGNLPRYRLEGGNLRLYPAPNSAMSGVIWYVPTRTLLVNGSDTINLPGGWEEYAIIDAAIRCGIKEESDVSTLMARKAEQKQRIEAAAARRDAAAPPRVTDVESGYIGEDPALARRWW